VSGNRILAVDDDPSIREMVRDYLVDNDFQVETAASGEEMNQVLETKGADLILLDVKLPGEDGFGIARALRMKSPVPIIMLTAQRDEVDRVVGLELGADDYLTKPFSPRELLARIRAVLRRHAGRAEPVLSQGAVTLDPAQRRVTLNGSPVLLSAREYAVLEALMTRPGAVLSRSQLEDRLYGWGEEIESNAVSVYIHQLRKKLGADFIRNVRGVGYFIDATPPGSGR